MSSTRTVVAGDTRFLLREDGQGGGTPVLLLHGVPETATCWRGVQPALAQGRRVLAPDLPGLGGSQYSGPYDVASLVAQLAALVDAEVGGPVDVVGHDWGGSLALALAGARPELVRRLAVANAPYRSVPLHRAVHVPFLALPLLPELVLRAAARQVVEAALSLGWKAPTPLPEQVRAEYAAAYASPDAVRAVLGYYRGAARPRVRALLPFGPADAAAPRVRAERMLVLWGARDPVLPLGTGEGVVRDLGPACTMTTVPGAGHFVIEEAPEVVVQALLELLG